MRAFFSARFIYGFFIKLQPTKWTELCERRRVGGGKIAFDSQHASAWKVNSFVVQKTSDALRGEKIFSLDGIMIYERFACEEENFRLFHAMYGVRYVVNSNFSRKTEIFTTSSTSMPLRNFAPFNRMRDY